MALILKRARTLAMRAVDAALPPRCVLTGDIVEAQGMISPEGWASLSFIAAPFCACCGVPFEFEMGKDALCVGCLDDKPSFATARAAVKYDDASRKLILGFKHGDKIHAAPAFMPWLRRAGVEILGAADAIIPVPLHPWRLVWRRYNQSAIIAFAMGKETGIKVLADALVRIRATPSQGHLKAKERFKNVRNAFALNPRHDVSGKIVVLIDDVYTTGATVRECSDVLMKAGASGVHVLTLARVAKAEFG